MCKRLRLRLRLFTVYTLLGGHQACNFGNHQSLCLFCKCDGLESSTNYFVHKQKFRLLYTLMLLILRNRFLHKLGCKMQTRYQIELFTVHYPNRILKTLKSGVQNRTGVHNSNRIHQTPTSKPLNPIC